jgi:hypothetical protein
MAHPQNSARGLFAKQAIDIGAQSLTVNSTGHIFEGALFVSGQTTRGKISANSTSLILPGTLSITGAAAGATITANSTGIKIGAMYITTNSTGTTIA